MKEASLCSGDRPQRFQRGCQDNRSSVALDDINLDKARYNYDNTGDGHNSQNDWIESDEEGAGGSGGGRGGGSSSGGGEGDGAGGGGREVYRRARDTHCKDMEDIRQEFQNDALEFTMNHDTTDAATATTEAEAEADYRTSLEAGFESLDCGEARPAESGMLPTNEGCSGLPVERSKGESLTSSQQRNTQSVIISAVADPNRFVVFVIDIYLCLFASSMLILCLII